MKIGITSKIITGTAIAVIIPLILTGLFEYFYFLDILKNNSIDDEKINLQQTEQQFSFIQDDIKTFSQHIIIDDTVQEILSSNKFDENMDYEQLLEEYDIFNHLINLSTLRNYIHSIILITKDDYIFSSIERFNNNYLEKTLKESWYTTFEKSGKTFTFTEPHYISVKGIESNVISYICNTKDPENSNISTSILIININYNYLENLLEKKNSNFESFLCITENNKLVYKSPETNINLFDNIKKATFTKIYSESSKNGYFVACKSPSSNWKYISYSTFDTIYKEVEHILYILIIIIIISFILTLLINIPITHNITKPIKKLSKSMDIASEGNLNIKIDVSTNDEISHLCKGFNNMIEQIDNFLKKKVEFEKEKKRLEFDLLLSQINPHFIYNILNAVIYMARKEKTKDIIIIIESFINILQKSLIIESDSLLFTIEKEINFTKSYIQIQKYRYRDRFEVIWDFDKSLYNYLIPKTLLQPLVENCIYHGISPKKEKGIIKISIKENIYNNIEISVIDNGIGMDKEEIKILESKNNSNLIKHGRKHIGIINIRDRIKFLFGNNYGINIISNKNKGTKILITLPKKI